MEGTHLSDEIKGDIILWQCVTDKMIEVVTQEKISQCSSKPRMITSASAHDASAYSSFQSRPIIRIFHNETTFYDQS